MRTNVARSVSFFSFSGESTFEQSCNRILVHRLLFSTSLGTELAFIKAQTFFLKNFC